MIKKTITILIAFTFSISALATEYITLLTDRSELHVKPLVEMFESKHNVKVNIITTKEGTIRSRIGDPSVDIVYAVDVTEAEELESNFTKLKNLPQINPELVSVNGKWVSPSYRVRGVYHSRDLKVSSNWKDIINYSICVRPLIHPYNVSMFQALGKDMIHIDNFMQSFYEKSIKPTSGNDRKQAQLMHDGKCDVAVLNSYYVKVMNNDPSYGEIVKNKTFTPLTINGKVVILQSAVAVVKDSELNHSFIEFVLSPEAQSFITEQVGEYGYNQKQEVVSARGLTNRKQVFESLKSVSR